MNFDENEICLILNPLTEEISIENKKKILE